MRKNELRALSLVPLREVSDPVSVHRNMWWVTIYDNIAFDKFGTPIARETHEAALELRDSLVPEGDVIYMETVHIRESQLAEHSSRRIDRLFLSHPKVSSE